MANMLVNGHHRALILRHLVLRSLHWHLIISRHGDGLMGEGSARIKFANLTIDGDSRRQVCWKCVIGRLIDVGRGDALHRLHDIEIAWVGRIRKLILLCRNYLKGCISITCHGSSCMEKTLKHLLLTYKNK